MKISLYLIFQQKHWKEQKRLGKDAEKVKWIVSDITNFEPENHYEIWHDRATFHFLTTPEQIAKYISIAKQYVTGYMTIGTFSVDGQPNAVVLRLSNMMSNLYL